MALNLDDNPDDLKAIQELAELFNGNFDESVEKVEAMPPGDAERLLSYFDGVNVDEYPRSKYDMAYEACKRALNKRMSDATVQKLEANAEDLKTFQDLEDLGQQDEDALYEKINALPAEEYNRLNVYFKEDPAYVLEKKYKQTSYFFNLIGTREVMDESMNKDGVGA